MRIIKISLVIIFLGTIAFVAWNWSGKEIKPPPVVAKGGGFVTEINEEMELLRAMPVNSFSKRQYDITSFQDYFIYMRLNLLTRPCMFLKGMNGILKNWTPSEGKSCFYKNQLI
jgi:hypothetical protein